MIFCKCEKEGTKWSFLANKKNYEIFFQSLASDRFHYLIFFYMIQIYLDLFQIRKSQLIKKYMREAIETLINGKEHLSS